MMTDTLNSEEEDMLLDRILNSKNLVYKSLDATWKKNEVIAHNISNADTPGYKRMHVTFEEELNAAMDSPSFDKAEVNHMAVKVERDNTTSARADGNNVNPDIEMAELAKNTIKYNALVQTASFKKILMVLKDSK